MWEVGFSWGGVGSVPGSSLSRTQLANAWGREGAVRGSGEEQGKM